MGRVGLKNLTSMLENIQHTGGIMNIEALRKLAGREEVDYQFLMSVLKNYAYPRNKILEWLNAGDLVRIKKGLYIFGKRAAMVPYSPEILANLIYGPSAISLTYALAFYGLIPERVATVTSITNKRNKTFSTPVGRFVYYYLHPEKYSVAIELKLVTAGRAFLIASPEKALCDQIYVMDKKMKITTVQDIELYLFQDMRVDEDNFKKLKIENIEKISDVYKNKKIDLLLRLLTKVKNNA
jgi:hypothetical protein